jgi:hypothetical protein
LCLNQLIDQRGSGSETHTLPLTACRNRQAGGKVSFSSAWFTDQEHWFGTFQIATFGQSPDA